MKKLFSLVLLAYIGFSCSAPDRRAGEETDKDSISTTNNYSELWSIEKANDWYEKQGWLVGCNFSPSTAINQLEMWQEESFDPETIDRELGWAEDLGFNTIRVYLHDLLWEQDSTGFLDRMYQCFVISDRHGIKVLFVLFAGYGILILNWERNRSQHHMFIILVGYRVQV